MKHFCNLLYGVCSAVCNFKNTLPTVEDIEEMQKDVQRIENLVQTPTIINWLPISE